MKRMKSPHQFLRLIAVFKKHMAEQSTTTVEAGQEEAKNACRDDQLYAGLEAGIEGGIYAVNQWWKEIELEESNGFLLVDALDFQT
jgi:hypothetical protein